MQLCSAVFKGILAWQVLLLITHEIKEKNVAGLTCKRQLCSAISWEFDMAHVTANYTTIFLKTKKKNKITIKKHITGLARRGKRCLAFSKGIWYGKYCCCCAIQKYCRPGTDKGTAHGRLQGKFVWEVLQCCGNTKLLPVWHAKKGCAWPSPSEVCMGSTAMLW